MIALDSLHQMRKVMRENALDTDTMRWYISRKFFEEVYAELQRYSLSDYSGTHHTGSPLIMGIPAETYCPYPMVRAVLTNEHTPYAVALLQDGSVVLTTTHELMSATSEGESGERRST